MQNFGADYSCTIKTPWGESAWRAEDIPQAISAINESNGVILGGDVISPEMKSTYDSWYYQPTWKTGDSYVSSLRKNTEESIRCAEEYIKRYVDTHGDQYLFIFVVCTGNEALLYSNRRDNTENSLRDAE